MAGWALLLPRGYDDREQQKTTEIKYHRIYKWSGSLGRWSHLAHPGTYLPRRARLRIHVDNRHGKLSYLLPWYVVFEPFEEEEKKRKPVSMVEPYRRLRARNIR